MVDFVFNIRNELGKDLCDPDSEMLTSDTRQSVGYEDFLQFFFSNTFKVQ